MLRHYNCLRSMVAVEDDASKSADENMPTANRGDVPSEESKVIIGEDLNPPQNVEHEEAPIVRGSEMLG